VHFSFDSLAHYLDKLNRYTDGEAANMQRDGKAFHWQGAIRHFVHNFKSYYDSGAAGAKDGVHGILYSFLSAFYRFEQHAKLYERGCYESKSAVLATHTHHYQGNSCIILIGLQHIVRWAISEQPA
jgi:hypothetical protein